MTKLYEMAVAGRRAFRAAYKKEREKNKLLRTALEQVRVKAIPAGAAFVRGNEDRKQRVLDVLEIIDSALMGVR